MPSPQVSMTLLWCSRQRRILGIPGNSTRHVRGGILDECIGGIEAALLAHGGEGSLPLISNVNGIRQRPAARNTTTGVTSDLCRCQRRSLDLMAASCRYRTDRARERGHAAPAAVGAQSPAFLITGVVLVFALPASGNAPPDPGPDPYVAARPNQRRAADSRSAHLTSRRNRRG